eukprot:4878516-Prymnesium_polylepis.2
MAGSGVSAPLAVWPRRVTVYSLKPSSGCSSCSVAGGGRARRLPAAACATAFTLLLAVFSGWSVMCSLLPRTAASNDTDAALLGA